MAERPYLDPSRLFQQIGKELDPLQNEEVIDKLLRQEAINPDAAEALLHKHPALFKTIAVLALGGATLYAMGKARNADINTFAKEVGFGPQVEYRHKQTVRRALSFLQEKTDYVTYNRKRSRFSRWILGDPDFIPSPEETTIIPFRKLLRHNPKEEEWYEERNCKNEDEEMFNPPDQITDKDRKELIGWAKQVCLGCAVREQCLEFALKHKEPSGIWGGKTTSERKAILKQRNSKK